MNGFALDSNIVSVHLRGDVMVGTRIKENARLAKMGSIIPENDCWIAATCLVHDFTLATRDKHFDSVEGLRTVRWE